MNKLQHFQTEKLIEDLINQIVDLKLKRQSKETKLKIQKLQQELDSLENSL